MLEKLLTDDDFHLVSTWFHNTGIDRNNREYFSFYRKMDSVDLLCYVIPDMFTEGFYTVTLLANGEYYDMSTITDNPFPIVHAMLNYGPYESALRGHVEAHGQVYGSEVDK